MSQKMRWGTSEFYGDALTLPSYQQVLGGIRTGVEVDRSAQQGVTKVVIGDLSGGLRPNPGVGSWLRDLNTYTYNQGLQTRFPSPPILPYAVTNQSAMAAIDISAYVAANIRLHSILSALGTTGLRWYGFLGPNMYRDTSLSNSALAAPTTDNLTTDNVTAVAEVVWNSTRYLVVRSEEHTS